MILLTIVLIVVVMKKILGTGLMIGFAGLAIGLELNTEQDANVKKPFDPPKYSQMTFSRFVFDFGSQRMFYVRSSAEVASENFEIYSRGSQLHVELIGIPAEATVKLKYVVGGDDKSAQFVEWQQSKSGPGLSRLAVATADEVLIGFASDSARSQLRPLIDALNIQIDARLLKKGVDAPVEDQAIVSAVGKIEELLIGLERSVGQRTLLESQGIYEAINRVKVSLKGVLDGLPSMKSTVSNKVLTISNVDFDGRLTVEVMPNGEGAKLVTASLPILVARKPGIVTNLSTGVNFIVSPRQTYSTATTTVNNVSASRIVAQRNSIEVLPSLQGNIHVVLEDDNAEKFTFLTQILTLGLYDRRRHRIGFSISPGLESREGEELSGSLSLGVSWFLDRDLKMAVQYGILFRREEELFGGFKVGDGAPTVPFTRSVIRPSFFMGFSYSFGS